MRQTFFHELEELEKQEKSEKEERKKIELYLRKDGRSRNARDFLPFFSVLVVVLLAGTVATYALYLFVNVSRIGNVANIHISNVLSLASRSIFGGVYNNPELGIKNWMIFESEQDGITMRYPESWKSAKKSSHLFEIRKYNSQASINESLAAALFLDKYANEKKTDMETFVSEKSGVEKKLLTKQSRNGTDFFRTGKISDDLGRPLGMIFWERKGRVYSLKVIYYNQKNQVGEQEFEKIFSVMEINQ